MGGRYQRIPGFEEALVPILSFLHLAGVPPERSPDLKTQVVKAFIFCFGAFSVAHAIFSVPFYSDDIDSLSMIVYHASFFSLTPIAHLLIITCIDSLCHVFEGVTYSYDYGSNVMQNSHDELIKSKAANVARLGRLLPIFVVIMMTNLFISGLLAKYAFGEKHMGVFPIWYPSFIDQDILIVNLFTFIHQLACMNLPGFLIFSGASVLYSMCNHLTSEFLLVERALALLKDRAMEIAEAERVSLRQGYIKAVNMCAEHHLALLEYFRRIQPLLEIIFTLCSIVGMILLTCTGFAFTSNNTTVKVKFVVITGIELIFLFAASYFAEEVVKMGITTNAAVYNVDWFSLPKECRSTLRIFLLGSQRPLTSRTILGQQVNLAGYMTMIKASYSYFNMLFVATSEQDVGF